MKKSLFVVILSLILFFNLSFATFAQGSATATITVLLNNDEYISGATIACYQVDNDDTRGTNIVNISTNSQGKAVWNIQVDPKYDEHYCLLSNPNRECVMPVSNGSTTVRIEDVNSGGSFTGTITLKDDTTTPGCEQTPTPISSPTKEMAPTSIPTLSPTAQPTNTPTPTNEVDNSVDERESNPNVTDEDTSESPPSDTQGEEDEEDIENAEDSNNTFPSLIIIGVVTGLLVTFGSIVVFGIYKYGWFRR